MKNFSRMIGALAISMMVSKAAEAQDIHFSQFYENAILRNPALTGIFSGDYKAGVNYRNQWSNISVPFQTLLASVEARIPVSEETGDCVSLGVTATYDKAGSINFNSLQIYPAINYNKSLEDAHHSFLSVGFTAGYIQRSVDPNKMTFATQYQGGSYNANNPTGENITSVKMDYYDLGAGISLNSSLGEDNAVNYYIGAAAYHINKPKIAFSENESFLRLDTKWNGNLGVQWMTGAKSGITIHANYSKQGKYQEVIGGVLANFRSIDPAEHVLFTLYGGVFYRLNDAFIPTVKLDYRSYSFILSYDFTTSTLRPATNGMGGLELSIYARGGLSRGLWAQDKTKCPRFEQGMLPTFQ